MAFRILCDEHVPPQTAEYLEKDGHEARHVVDEPGAGTDDPAVAAHATATGYTLLTNDADFLDESEYPELSVFYYPESDAPAWDLATAIADVDTHYESSEELPRTVFL